MSTSKIYALTSSLFVFLTIFTSEASFNYTAHHCSNATIRNATFRRNLNVLLYSLTSNASQFGGYYMTIMGFGTIDAVNGLFLCRGDIVSHTICQECVTAAANDITSRCPNRTEAIIWYDQCMLRYTDKFFWFNSAVPRVTLDDGKIFSGRDLEQFNFSLFSLLNDLSTKAAKSPTVKKFAVGEAILSSSPLTTLYALEQCTHDLTSDQCETCLRKAIETFVGNCCVGKQGARVLLASCNIRYELYPFYNVTAVSPGPVVRFPPPSGKEINETRRIVLVVVPVSVVVMIFCLGGFFLLKIRKRHKTAIAEIQLGIRLYICIIDGEELTPLESLQFSFATIEAATNNFSQLNKIGKGGFGEVYKGVLPDKREIAVKKLSSKSKQGVVEFKNEISLIANLQHRNLVALIGFCLEEDEKMLIYEYVPNKSLDYFLFDTNPKRRILNWSERYKIIRDIARGVLYLHEYSRLKVIHRDLKPSNVLLDDNMNSKISDFGLARIVATNQNQEITNRIVGTHGYMSPEYAMYGRFSEKLDIYSFGVIILQIISAKRIARSPISKIFEDLLSQAWRQWRNHTPLEIMESTLKETYSRTEVIKCIQIGLLCVQEDPDDRPTMATVISYLNTQLIDLPFPREPALFRYSAGKSTNMEDGDCSSGQPSIDCSSGLSSINDMSKSTFFPR
ncbi:putative receptor-like protein kinase At4g00960 [Neltuma alba]|uniref:putative receptor-like protein kinase At4g00960 n=1 Tax=Neltuma alba TaxID=207710 RepID=UPI0010A3684D|nr:putative receptor-like protein kinase At4g00960 [Prosopis alba]